MKKKGSHVSVILSFVIFIAFIFFIYFITKPALNFDSQSQPLDQISKKLIENASGDVTVVTVSILPQGFSCVSLSGFLNTVPLGSRIIATDSKGNPLITQIDGSDLLLEGNSSNVLFKIYSSQEFNPTPTGPINPCNSLSLGSDYLIGMVKTNEMVLESKTIGLMTNLSMDYSGFRSAMGIYQNEFDFSFTYSNKTEIFTNRKNLIVPTSINIYSTNIPITYINSQGKVEAGFFNVRIW